MAVCLQSTAPILLVEDNPDDVFLFRRACAKAGLKFPIYSVENGEEGVKFLTQILAEPGALLPCVAFIDIKMPKMNGFEFLQWFKAQPRLCKIPALILTSSEFETDREAAARLDAADFLVKPPNSSMLVEILREVEGRWLHSFRLPIGDRALNNQTV
jgi:CheY-like chemotaxis protein